MLQPREARPHYVYELYDEDGMCLYVGVSWLIATRLQQHSWKQPWWLDVARMEITTHPNFEAGSRAEAERICTLQPFYNKRLTAHPYKGNLKTGETLGENGS